MGQRLEGLPCQSVFANLRMGKQEPRNFERALRFGRIKQKWWGDTGHSGLPGRRETENFVKIGQSLSAE